MYWVIPSYHVHVLYHSFILLLQVTVEYGADLHSSIHGSGFPMCDDSLLVGRMGGVDSEEFKYSESGWNLNNIPNLKVLPVNQSINDCWSSISLAKNKVYKIISKHSHKQQYYHEMR